MDFFKIFSRNKDNSKNVAKERLKLVLVHDRADISPKLLEKMEEDIIALISKYVDIDEEELEVKLTKMKKDKDKAPVSTLVANIPILQVKEEYKDEIKTEEVE